MSSRRENPSLFNLNDQVIPPPNSYQYLSAVDQYPFDSGATKNSHVNAWWLAEMATLAYEESFKIIEELNKLPNYRVAILDEANQFSIDGFFVEFEKFAVVCFRGTEVPKLHQFLNNEKVRQAFDDIETDSTVTYDVELRETSVHRGMSDSLNLVWQELYDLLTSIQKPVWFTGHSLGGALANLAAFRWNNPMQVGGVYTIGGPAIGSRQFKEKYDDELGSKTFRYIYGDDIVTNVANLARITPLVTNFEHVGQAIYFPRSMTWIEQFFFRFFLSTVDHAPIFYLNSLWNQLIGDG